MKKENSIQEIKNTLSKLLRLSKEVKCGTLILTDGTNVSISSEELEIGAEVYMLDDLGNQTPCNDGDYVLQDGRTFTVVSGKISEIKGITEDKPEDGDTTTTVAETLTADLPEAEAEIEDGAGVDGDLMKRVADLETKLSDVLDLISKLSNGQNEMNEQLMARIKKFGSEAGDEPVKMGKKGYTEYSSENSTKKQKDDNFRELKELMAQKRKMSN
jgi:hypothetical protein